MKNISQMTHASLFSGIGGAELAAEWNGIENVFHCERNEFGKKVLDFWYPKAASYDDITKTDFTEWGGKVDILSGGFPCQPFSTAGKRRGAGDDRYLWPEMRRAIRQIKPRYIVGENVVGILSMVEPEGGDPAAQMDGQTDECGEGYDHYEKKGLFTAERICRDIENEGYDVQPVVIPACAVNAPHRRSRVWFLAKRRVPTEDGWKPRAEGEGQHEGVRADKADTDAVRDRPKERMDKNGEGGIWPENVNKHSELFRIPRGEEHRRPSWDFFPTQPPVLGGDDGLPAMVDDLSFLSIPYAKFRAETIKAMGNAWVPQVAYEIFKAIREDFERDNA